MNPSDALIFDVPFVSKNYATAEGDGFEICSRGQAEVKNHWLYMYEADDAHSADATPVLALKLTNLHSIKATKFTSSSGRYRGGRVELVGPMGQAWTERLVMKMQTSEYKRFKEVLRALPRN
jgi:hypothetical protein